MLAALLKVFTIGRQRMASVATASLPPAAAAEALSFSSRLRALADQLDGSKHDKTVHQQVSEVLKQLSEQLLNSTPVQQPATGDAAVAQQLERSDAAPAADPQEQQQQRKDTAAQQPKTKRQRRGERTFDFGKYSQRYVALHLMYIGWGYQGLARQADSENTIEGVLFPALRRVKLIPEDADISTLDYSRCGRTDKGVSALGQVLALRLRSKALAGEGLPDAAAELDYPTLINRALPDSVRVLGWADAAPEFSARFDCKDREYKYFIVQDGSLDLAAMQAAAQHLVGEHDFRNFCKADVAQVKNFRREVLSACIEAASTCCPGMNVVGLRIKGTAFLWHQVRCIAAVLLMVGRGQEQPSIIQQLLDISQYPSKPQYPLAAEEPLLLYSCGFNSIRWQRNESNLAKCLAVIGKQLQQHLVAAALTSSIFEQLQQDRATLILLSVQQREQEQQEQQQEVGMAATQDGQKDWCSLPVQTQQQQQQHLHRGSIGSGLCATGTSRWLAPKTPHIRLSKRATEPSIEDRFKKAGISLDLLN